MPLARSVAASAAASTSSEKSIVPDDQRALGRIGHERRRVLVRRRPSRTGASSTRSFARPFRRGRHRRASSPADRRAAAASRSPACCRSGPCASCPAPSAATGSPGPSGRRGDAAELLDPRDRGRAADRQPQAAVGGEPLLRREVVDVGLGDVDRQAGGARGRVDRDQRVAGVTGPHDRDHHPGRGLVVGPGEQVGGGDRPCGAGASPGSAETMIGSARNGAPFVQAANFDENSP